VRVGITVVLAALTLAVLIFLMSGTAGFLTNKITLYAYFDNAEGLLVGAPVNLHGVAIGNVKGIKVVPGRQLDPVQIAMKVNTKYQFFLRRDSTATIKTAGVLGQSFVDLESKGAVGEQVRDSDTLPSLNAPGLEDVVRSSQSTLQNMDILVRRLDRIVAQVESGKGSIGKLISDPSVYNKLNLMLTEIQTLVSGISSGKGSIGKLISDDELYRKANDTVDKLDKMVDQMNRGEGSLGLFIKDPSLYHNANQTMASANRLLDNINAGHGALGKFTHDEAFAKKLENTVNRLSQMLDRINAGEGTAGRLLQDPSIYNNTDQMLIETRNLIKAIRENPKKYLTIHMRIF
jgi:phospholipid/cholesterol/gamma-HCH transport system substrate-binding protein